MIQSRNDILTELNDAFTPFKRMQTLITLKTKQPHQCKHKNMKHSKLTLKNLTFPSVHEIMVSSRATKNCFYVKITLISTI